jgi:hypothetical protein
MPTLPPDQVSKFIEYGFVHLPGTFSRALADECRAILWAETGVDPDNSTTWRRPIIRIGDRAEEPFRLVANTPRLHDTFDQLVGPCRWLAGASLGGFPIRFPEPDQPDDAPGGAPLDPALS